MSPGGTRLVTPTSTEIAQPAGRATASLDHRDGIAGSAPQERAEWSRCVFLIAGGSPPGRRRSIRRVESGLNPSWGMQMMQQEVPGLSNPLDPSDWRKVLPLESAAASDGLGWVGLEAIRFRALPTSEINVTALT